MLHSLITVLGESSLVSLQELQQLFLYFYTHAWLGLFFILQVLGLLVTKARADSINGLRGLYTARHRLVFGVACTTFSRTRVSLFHY
jgi:hypothetical protein